MTVEKDNPDEPGTAKVLEFRHRYRNCYERFLRDLEKGCASDLFLYLEYDPVDHADCKFVFADLLIHHFKRQKTENAIAAESEYIRMYPSYRSVIKSVFAKRIRVGEKITITQFLDSGGMGDIYKAISANDQASVVKILREDQLENFCNSVLHREAGLNGNGRRDYRREALARFKREVQITSALQNPETVCAYDAGVVKEDGKSLYLEMEFVDGLSLDDFQRKFQKRCGSRLTVGAVCELIAQVAETMQNFHQSIVHRDIKPSNIMAVLRNGDGNRFTKVLDFGLAKHHPCLDDSPQLTFMADYLGTPEYSSPEQFNFASFVEPVSDIYSLGCTMYELLDDSMAPPFASQREKSCAVDAWHSFLKNAHNSGLPEIRRSGLPPGVQTVFKKMTEINPDERFDAGGVVRALHKHRRLDELRESVRAFNEKRNYRKRRWFF